MTARTEELVNKRLDDPQLLREAVEALFQEKKFLSRFPASAVKIKPCTRWVRVPSTAAVGIAVWKTESVAEVKRGSKCHNGKTQASQRGNDIAVKQIQGITAEEACAGLDFLGENGRSEIGDISRSATADGMLSQHEGSDGEGIGIEALDILNGEGAGLDDLRRSSHNKSVPKFARASVAPGTPGRIVAPGTPGRFVGDAELDMLSEGDTDSDNADSDSDFHMEMPRKSEDAPPAGRPSTNSGGRPVSRTPERLPGDDGLDSLSEDSNDASDADIDDHFPMETPSSSKAALGSAVLPKPRAAGPPVPALRQDRLAISTEALTQAPAELRRLAKAGDPSIDVLVGDEVC